MKKLNNLLIIVVTLISYIIALNYLKNKLYVDLLKTIMILPVMLIPRFLNKINIKIDKKLEFTYLIFILFAYFFGVIINLYDKINSYDTIMHFLSGVFTGYISLYLLTDNNKIHNILFILGFVSLIAVSWETFEYVSSHLFDVDPQKVETTGINDTMKDILVALLGGILVTIFGNKRRR